MVITDCMKHFLVLLPIDVEENSKRKFTVEKASKIIFS